MLSPHQKATIEGIVAGLAAGYITPAQADLAFIKVTLEA